MGTASTSMEMPYKELWKIPLVGQTLDVKLNSIYEGLGEIQKLVLDRTKSENEQRLFEGEYISVHLATQPNQGSHP